MRKGTPYGKMSSSDRRRSSKWDLKEESRIAYEDIHDSGKSGLSFHDRDSRDWLSPEAPIGNHSKWSVPESLPGRRGSRRDDSIDEDRNRSLKGMATWEVEESYGTRMSPGLEDWRQQSHHKSPKNEWKRSRRSRSQSQSRSRSRSPIRDFGRESGPYDRSRSRSGASAQVCKDYAASGWCRRGNHCHFLHAQTYEDGWERQRKNMTPKYPMPHDSREYPAGSGKSTDCCTEFLKGSCRRGSSCRFSHHGASHMAGKVSNEITRERNNDRRQRDSSLERHNDREPRRAAAIPCKFFAAGNCRNGKYCRFAHQDQTYPSPDRSRDGRISLDHHSADGGKLLTKWSTSSDGGNFSEDKDEIIVVANQRETVRSVDNRWGHRLEEDKKLSESLTHDRMVESEKNEVLPWKNENADDSKLASEQRVSENWLGDMDMSPEWTYNVQPSKPIDKQVPLTNCNPNMIKQATVQMHSSIEVMPSERNESYAKPPDLNLAGAGVSALLHDDRIMAGPPGSHGIILSDMRPVHSFNQNGLSSNALPLTGSSAVGHGRVAFPNSGGTISPPIQMSVQVGKAINKPDVVEPIASQLNSGVAITQNNVSSEQLSTISASLAQLIANAACGSLAHNMAKTSAFDNEGPIKMDSAVNLQSNETMRVQNHQYNPIRDSIDAEKHEVIGNNPPGFFPPLNMQKNTANEKQEIILNNKIISSAVTATESSDKNMISGREEAKDKSCQVEPGGNSSIVAKENNGLVNEESTKVEENKDAQENGSLENNDGDEKNDDGKKGKDKDSKGLRAFKFALVEFAKELLKPAWKEGQMSKDAYKNIVKKVVEKVTGTMKEANVPQTQEKIQQYLSFSKPKLTKLVQAYVEKFQKDK